MKIGLCKFCERAGPLARSHIVPKAFYNTLPQEPLMLFSGSLNGRAKRVPAGIYDENLLCESCEEKLSHIDSEAAAILKSRPRRTQYLKDNAGFILRIGNKKAGYSIQLHSVPALDAFFCFLLWRMAVTTRLEMRLDLTPTLIVALRSAIENDSFQDIGFKIFAARSFETTSQFVANPRIRNDGDKITINLNFYGYQLTIQSACDDEMNKFALTRGRDWIVLIQEFHETKLYEAAKAIAEKTPNPWARLHAKRKST